MYFTVAAEYAVADKEFTFDTAWGQSVQRAAQNAQRIVNRSKGPSDVNKLYTYKNAVCGLVSYNSAAAGGDVPYGNPWQLVWVFDGDTATNVVCEGYSKAFQYLCDLSDFSAAVTVISPYGYMASASGGERHMWNVVTMGDGRNYLADLTNCDEGTVGYPNALFLTGALYGDTASGYVFSAGGKQYTYQYDSDVLSLFSENELQMSLSAYSVEASSLLTAEEKLAASEAEAQGPAEIQQRQDYPVTLALPAGLSADYLRNHDRVSAVFYAESDGYRQPVAAAETRLYDSSWWEIAFPDANTVRLTLDACRDFDAGSYKAVLSNSRQDGSETIFSRECYFTILPAEAPAAMDAHLAQTVYYLDEPIAGQLSAAGAEALDCRLRTTDSADVFRRLTTVNGGIQLDDTSFSFDNPGAGSWEAELFFRVDGRWGQGIPLSLTVHDESRPAHPLTLHTPASAEIAQAGETVYFSFTPDRTARYRFSAPEGTQVLLYSPNWTALAQAADDEASGLSLSCLLEADTLYHISAAYTSSDATGSFPVLLSFETATLTQDAPCGSGTLPPGGWAFFAFVPETDSTYALIPEGSTGACALYDADWQPMELPEQLPFTCALNAGTNYRFGVQYSGSEAGDFSISVTPYVPVERIALSLTELQPGESATPVCQIYPENASYPIVRYQPAEDGMYSVSAEGSITALQCGSTLLRAYAAENSAITAQAPLLVHHAIAFTAQAGLSPLDEILVTFNGAAGAEDSLHGLILSFDDPVLSIRQAACADAAGAPVDTRLQKETDGDGAVFRLCAVEPNGLPINGLSITLQLEATAASGHWGTEQTFPFRELYAVYQLEDGTLTQPLRDVSYPSGFIVQFPSAPSVLLQPDLMLPADLQVIAEEAFAGIPAARVLLQDGVKEIGSRAFADCHNLRQIYLPASVQSIAEDTFSGVSDLTLFGPAGSAAEAYALHHGLAFDAVEALPLP